LTSKPWRAHTDMMASQVIVLGSWQNISWSSACAAPKAK